MKIKNILAGIGLACLGMGALAGCSLSGEQKEALNILTDNQEQLESLLEYQNFKMDKEKGYSVLKLAWFNEMNSRNGIKGVEATRRMECEEGFDEMSYGAVCKTSDNLHLFLQYDCTNEKIPYTILKSNYDGEEWLAQEVYFNEDGSVYSYKEEKKSFFWITSSIITSISGIDFDNLSIDDIVDVKYENNKYYISVVQKIDEETTITGKYVITKDGFFESGNVVETKLPAENISDCEITTTEFVCKYGDDVDLTMLNEQLEVLDICTAYNVLKLAGVNEANSSNGIKGVEATRRTEREEGVSEMSYGAVCKTSDNLHLFLQYDCTNEKIPYSMNKSICDGESWTTKSLYFNEDGSVNSCQETNGNMGEMTLTMISLLSGIDFDNLSINNIVDAKYENNKYYISVVQKIDEETTITGNYVVTKDGFFESGSVVETKISNDNPGDCETTTTEFECKYGDDVDLTMLNEQLEILDAYTPSGE